MKVRQCVSHIATLEASCAQAQQNQSVETHVMQPQMHIALRTGANKLGRDSLKASTITLFDQSHPTNLIKTMSTALKWAPGDDRVLDSDQKMNS